MCANVLAQPGCSVGNIVFQRCCIVVSLQLRGIAGGTKYIGSWHKNKCVRLQILTSTMVVKNRFFLNRNEACTIPLYGWGVLCSREMLMLPVAFKICASFWLWVSVFRTNAFVLQLSHPGFFSHIIPPGMARKGNVYWKLLSAGGELSDPLFLRQILKRAL